MGAILKWGRYWRGRFCNGAIWLAFNCLTLTGTRHYTSNNNSMQ